MGSEGKEVTVEIQMEEGDPLGAKPNENLVITYIQPDTLAYGKLQEGDRVVSVNNNQPRDLRHFFDLIRHAGRSGCATLKVVRDQKAQEELNQIPKERAQKIQIHGGWSYKVSFGFLAFHTFFI